MFDADRLTRLLRIDFDLPADGSGDDELTHRLAYQKGRMAGAFETAQRSRQRLELRRRYISLCRRQAEALEHEHRMAVVRRWQPCR